MDILLSKHFFFNAQVILHPYTSIRFLHRRDLNLDPLFEDFFFFLLNLFQDFIITFFLLLLLFLSRHVNLYI